MPAAEGSAHALRISWLVITLCVGACAPSARTGDATPRLSGDTESGCAAGAASLPDARQLVTKYCVTCHSPNGAASDYDWSDERTLLAHRRNVAAKLAQGSMPPPGTPQPSASERRALRCWASD